MSERTENLRIQTRRVSIVMLFSSLIILLTNSIFYSETYLMLAHSVIGFVTSMFGLTGTQKRISYANRRRHLALHNAAFFVFLVILWANITLAFHLFTITWVFFCWVPCGVGYSAAIFPGVRYFRHLTKQTIQSENVVIQETPIQQILPLNSMHSSLDGDPEPLDFSDFIGTPPPPYSLSLHHNVILVPDQPVSVNPEAMDNFTIEPSNPNIIDANNNESFVATTQIRSQTEVEIQLEALPTITQVTNETSSSMPELINDSSSTLPDSDTQQIPSLPEIPDEM